MCGMTMNMLKVQRFLNYFSIRTGTLIILWWTLIYSCNLLMFITAVEVKEDATFLFILMALLLMGIIISLASLLYFPSADKKYTVDSINAKCIKYFSWYNGFIMVSAMITYAVALIATVTDEPAPPPDDDLAVVARVLWDQLLLLGVLASVVAGLHTHFMAVSYSFYLSMFAENASYDTVMGNTNSSELNGISMTGSGRRTYGIKLPMPPLTSRFAENGCSAYPGRV